MKKIPVRSKRGITTVEAVVDDDFYEIAASTQWWMSTNGYVVGIVNAKMALLHRLVKNSPPGIQVDHINGNTLDNRLLNLRDCTQSQNNMNRGVARNNTSGATGVTWESERGKWRAVVYANRRRHNIGRYDSFKEAAEARRAAAIKHHAEFARTGDES